jgi:very-short-patch-repair endonuclease
MTDAERAFWRHARDRRFMGLKFRRQVPIGKYIVDFLCIEKKIIVELDGGQHADSMAYDEKRTDFLNNCGYHLVRYWDNDVLKNMDGVLTDLAEQFGIQRPSPQPSPASRERAEEPFL